MANRNGIRTTVTDAAYKQAIHDLNNHAMRVIRRKGDGVYISRYEILGILTEEYNEAVEAIHLNLTDEALVHELLDIAFACLWGVASIRQRAAEHVKPNPKTETDKTDHSA